MSRKAKAPQGALPDPPIPQDSSLQGSQPPAPEEGPLMGGAVKALEAESLFAFADAMVQALQEDEDIFLTDIPPEKRLSPKLIEKLKAWAPKVPVVIEARHL